MPLYLKTQDSLLGRCVHIKTKNVSCLDDVPWWSLGHSVPWCAMTCLWLHEPANPSGSCFKSIHELPWGCIPYTPKNHGIARQTHSFGIPFSVPSVLLNLVTVQNLVDTCLMFTPPLIVETCWDKLRRWRNCCRHRNCPLLRCSDQWRMSARLLG